MSVKIEGNIMTIIEKEAEGGEPVILIWSINNTPVKAIYIDKALGKIYSKGDVLYKRQKSN